MAIFAMFRPGKSPMMSSWYFHFAVLLSMTNHFSGHVSCEFSYSYESDAFAVAVINISYTDPVTSLPKLESGEIGRFGYGRLEDISGPLIHVTSNNYTSHYACDRLDKDRLPREPFIALVKQGHCKDHIKLKYIMETNASGVIVYTYYFDSRVFKLRHEVFLLPYIFITARKGEELAALLENGTKVMMSVEMSSTNGFRYANINRTSVLFVSISFIILMVISMAWLVFYYVQRFRYIIAKDMLSRRLCSAAKKALDKIPIKTVKPKDCDKGEGEEGEEDQECCAICIEPLKADEVIRILPCKHSFHKTCVDPWLLDKRSCPMCKLDILQYFGLIYSGSQESMLELDANDIQRRRGSAIISDIIHVPISRRNSSSQTTPLTHDRATSPCSFVNLVPNDVSDEAMLEMIEVHVETCLLSPEVCRASPEEMSPEEAEKPDDKCECEILLVKDSIDRDSDA